jgi:N-acetylneuraminate epimerase
MVSGLRLFNMGFDFRFDKTLHDRTRGMNSWGHCQAAIRRPEFQIRLYYITNGTQIECLRDSGFSTLLRFVMQFMPALLWLLLPLNALSSWAAAFCQDFQPDLSELPPLPNTEGFAGSFAGVSGNHLLVIGGANFPDHKPWEGGTKVWYSSVLALPLVPENADPPACASGRADERSSGLDPMHVQHAHWLTAGQLDAPLGYGVSVTFRDEVFCVGGSRASGHVSAGFVLRFNGKNITHRKLPDLPLPRANHFGARIGQELFIAGGQQAADSTEAESGVWSLRLNEPDATWSQLPSFPGPARILAVAAASENCFWIIGGAALSKGPDGKPQRRYLKDVWTFSRETGWSRLPDLPNPCVAAPSPAPDFGQGPLILGGDDGTQAKTAPQSHRGFSQTMLLFSTREQRWVPAGLFPPATVTTPSVAVGNDWIIPTGEIRPGVRTPAVWLLRSPSP